MAEQRTRGTRAVAPSRAERAWRVVVVGISLVGIGCAETLPYTWVQDMPPPPATAPAEPIHPGDTVTVFVREQETLSGDFKVREDGTYPQPIVGAMHVAGRTSDQVTTLLKQRLQGVLAAPEATRRPAGFLPRRRARLCWSASIRSTTLAPTSTGRSSGRALPRALARAAFSTRAR